jgi:hypothetical protein
MNQVAQVAQRPLALEIAPKAPGVPMERTGFDIGWDHAHHGLVPPAELLHAGTPVAQGWMAGKSVFGPRCLPCGRFTRQWLALRLLAWRRGIVFDVEQVSANYLCQIHAARCPVTRMPLGGAAGQADAAQVERLNPHAGFAAGNLATLSEHAAQARAGLSVQQAVRQARAQQAGAAPAGGLDVAAWWRLAALQAFATPLPFAQVAQLPLAVLPPNRVRLLNAAQGLQALVTLLFATPGWSTRCRALALLLPAHTLRHDFNLFVGALAPRVLEAGRDAGAVRQALEDAWLQERVQRRWQHFVLSLGETATETLLDRAAAAGLAGVRTLCHGPEQAVDGWGLPASGQVQRVAQAVSAAGQVAAPVHPAAARPMGRPATTARPLMA